MKQAMLVLGVAEIAQIAQAFNTLADLVTRIQQNSPDVWADVQRDFTGAMQNWATSAPSDVAAIVAGNGQLPGMPAASTDAAPAGPTIEEGATVESGSVESFTEGAAPAQSAAGAIYAGADALPVGQHLAASKAPDDNGGAA